MMLLIIMALVSAVTVAAEEQNCEAVVESSISLVFPNTEGSIIEGNVIVSFVRDHTMEYMQTMSHRDRIRLIYWLWFGR